jgi:hypothetical protein
MIGFHGNAQGEAEDEVKEAGVQVRDQALVAAADAAMYQVKHAFRIESEAQVSAGL